MPREKTKAEIDNENRARAGMNALNRLGIAVKYIPSPFAKPVYDLISDAKRAVQLNEKYRAAICNRAKGMNDVFAYITNEGTDLIAVLTEVVYMVDSICLTESATYIEAQDISSMVKSLEPFQPVLDPI